VFPCACLVVKLFGAHSKCVSSRRSASGVKRLSYEANVKAVNKRIITEEVNCKEPMLTDAKRMRPCSPENAADIIEPGCTAETVERSQVDYCESEELKFYQQLIRSSPQLKEWRLQTGPCAKFFYEPCIACWRGNEKRNDYGGCRFANRMLRRVSDPRRSRRIKLRDVLHFKREEYVKAGIDDDEYARTAFNKRGRSSHDAQIAAYIIQCAKSAFRAVVDREERMLSNACPEDEAYFSHSYKTRQICDVCNFSVLNAHLCCVHCGTEVCPHCFDELKAGVARFAWKNLRCRSGTRHDESMFHLATFRLSFGTFKSLLDEVENQCKRYAIKKGAVCNGNHGRRRFQTEKCYCPRRSDEDEVTIEPICIIKDQMADDSYARFKAHLAVHHPVLVENVARHPKYRSELWSRDKHLKILDSSSFGRAFVDGKRCTLEQFWQVFESRHDCNEPYLKVKDFPEGMRFVDVAPEQFRNLFEVLPFLEYTRAALKKNCSKGRLNLLNLMSGYAGAPDPGPKAYICCGLCNAPHLSSTPLHLDVSNAANFLPLVQTPRLMSHDEIAKALKKRLDIEAIEGSERERVMRKPEKAGAIWKIFHPDDNGKIRDAIVEWKRIQGSKRREPGDAIHNQNVVVTPEMVQFFAQKGIRCRVFVQCEGEAVFVPSGAAHQVQNIHSCIKVAEDFVAAEGLDHIWRVNEELRSYKGKDDLLQVDTMMYRAMRWCVETLSCCEPGVTASSLEQ
uniref:JmjC domain-containing protein n=1 Tax=Parascaris univalens TaxID=6257 RepID=A0A915C5Q0_PARUN